MLLAIPPPALRLSPLSQDSATYSLKLKGERERERERDRYMHSLPASGATKDLMTGTASTLYTCILQVCERETIAIRLNTAQASSAHPFPQELSSWCLNSRYRALANMHADSRM